MDSAQEVGCDLRRRAGFAVTTIATAAVVAALGAPQARAGTFFLTVAGLGGEPEYEQRFSGWASDIERVLRSMPSDTQVVTLKGPEATKEKIKAALAEIGKKSSAQDILTVMLIGHGTYDGLDYKFNVPGPDVSAAELAGFLDRIPAKQLIVNMTSASGGAVSALQKPNRTLIVATKSGTEKNATVFARYWAEAMRDPGADTDKNETITALEAFRYAEQKTVKFYETEKRIATEHPMLEDTGSGQPVKNPSPENGQGLQAGRFPLLKIGAAQAIARDPKKQALLSRKEDLEQQIDRLKYQKAAMRTEDYKKQLSALLLELAKVQEELDQ